MILIMIIYDHFIYGACTQARVWKPWRHRYFTIKEEPINTLDNDVNITGASLLVEIILNISNRVFGRSGGFFQWLCWQKRL